MNVVCLMGNLGADPELRMTGKGDAVLKFSLATSYTWKDNAGAKQEKTEWHRCQMWGKRAEALARHLSKGAKVAIEGRIQYGSYDHKDGHKVYTCDIVVNNLHFAGGSKGGQSGGPSPYGGGYQKEEPEKAPDFDDDQIPF